MKKLGPIIMYHYVQPDNLGDEQQLRYCSLAIFREQIKFLLKRYKIVSLSEYIYNLNNNKCDRLAVLTFDDGTIDHYKFVIPELLKKGITGTFFPITSMLKKNPFPLEVHQIQYLLKCINNIDNFYKILCKLITNFFGKKELLKQQKLWLKKNNWDEKKIVFIKRTLEIGLEKKKRKECLDYLFKKFSNISPTTLAKNFYLKIRDLKEMKNNGFEIGIHGHMHKWLEFMNKNQQLNEIKKSLEILKSENLLSKDWTFCYPHGSFNYNTLEILNKLDCYGAVTINSNFPFEDCNVLTLPRIDTINFSLIKSNK